MAQPRVGHLHLAAVVGAAVPDPLQHPPALIRGRSTQLTDDSAHDRLSLGGGRAAGDGLLAQQVSAGLAVAEV